MGFFEDVIWVIALLQREGRLTYRGLQRACGFDEALLDDLRRELIFRRIAVDEHGQGLLWTGVMPHRTHAPTLPAPPSSLLANLTDLNLAEEPMLTSQDTPGSTPTTSTTPEIDTRSLSFNVPYTSLNIPSTDLQHEPSPATLPHETSTAPSRPLPRAELRQLTVMFCDLVGSTDLSGKLDPEDLRDIVRAYQESAANVITRYEGYIAQYLGDGLLIYFGFPVAHEDDANRAVYSALGIAEALDGLNTHLEMTYHVRLAVRIGIHTGPVVMGEMGSADRPENLALGEAPNIAARIEGLAAPNTTVLSSVTAQLVQRRFVLEELGRYELMGVVEPLTLFKVIGCHAAVDDGREAMDSDVFDALVGRDEEIGLIIRRWEQCREGQGQVVLISGEAGLGKSRLARGLRAHVSKEGYPCLWLRCSPFMVNSALHPVIEHLQRVFDWQRDDSAETKLTKLEEGLRGVRLALQETVPLIAALLSLPLPEGRYPIFSLTPQQQRQQTQDVLVAWMLEEAERRPLLVVWEDLHWADPSTLELLGLFIDQNPTVAMMTLLTYRPMFKPPWSAQSHITPIPLSRLQHFHIEALVAYLTRGKTLPNEVVQHLVDKTDGVPLYMEELTKMLLESDLLQEEIDAYVLTGSLSSASIPATLQDSLMARLDRLASAKEVAQIGAVIGRQFSYELLHSVSELDEATLQRELSQLVEAELVYQRGSGSQASYLFKHALIQDTAYQSLLRQTRQQYHFRIAQLLETQTPEIADVQPELVAHHYTAADLGVQAIRYWLRAGERAVRQSAHTEAIAHFTQGLALIPSLPDAPERIQRELELQIALATPLLATKGYAASEVGATYTRARELCQQVGETPQLIQVLFGLWMYYGVRAEFRTAFELAEQLLHLSQRQSAPGEGLEAHQALGITAYMRGALLDARDHFDRGIALYEPRYHRNHAFLYGQDSKIVCFCHLSVVLWLLGYPDQSQRCNDEARVLAQELSHALSQSWPLLYTTMVQTLCRDQTEALTSAEALLTLCREQGLTYRLLQGRLLRGWGYVMLGQAEDDLGKMVQDIHAIVETGAEVYRPYYLALLAQAHGALGQYAAALTVLSEALALVEQHEEHWYEAELYRIQGDVLLRHLPDEGVQAEASFQRSLAVSRRQHARSWELRAAMSLSQLWQQQDKQKEAFELLAPIYAWFTEGFETADLKEAKALLSELE